MKTCVTCKHFIARELGPEFAKCAISARANPVTGEMKERYCESERMIGEGCGPDGLKWKERDEQKAAA